MDTYITVTGSCPHCNHALKLCRAKSGAHYLGCSGFPNCDWRGVYDPVLQQLRDRNARLQAELELIRMQYGPTNQERKTALTTWATVVAERKTALTTWADVAHRWGVQK